MNQCHEGGFSSRGSEVRQLMAAGSSLSLVPSLSVWFRPSGFGGLFFLYSLNGTPGMEFDQLGEVGFQLLGAQTIRATIETMRDPAHRTSINVNDAVTQAL